MDLVDALGWHHFQVLPEALFDVKRIVAETNHGRDAMHQMCYDALTHDHPMSQASRNSYGPLWCSVHDTLRGQKAALAASVQELNPWSRVPELCDYLLKKMGDINFNEVYVVGEDEFDRAAHARRATRPHIDESDEERLTFDDDTMTVTLDGEPHQVKDPKAYGLYKLLVGAGRSPLTRKAIALKLPGMRGSKAVPRARQKLPEALEATIQSNNTGLWIALPKIVRA